MKAAIQQPAVDRTRALADYYSALRASFGPQHWWPARTRLEVILGAILTQNTSWRNAAFAITNLRRAGLLSWRGLRSATLSRLEGCVHPAGFFRQKAKAIHNFADWLAREHNGSLDRLFSLGDSELRERLLELRGLGPETADAIMLYAAGRATFVADAYTRRILGRHGILPEDAGYDDTQAVLHRHLPREAECYNEFHALLVELGKRHCTRQRPRCSGCPLESYLPLTGSCAASKQPAAEEAELQPV
jgi:endonuclease III related protein